MYNTVRTPERNESGSTWLTGLLIEPEDLRLSGEQVGPVSSGTVAVTAGRKKYHLRLCANGFTVHLRGRGNLHVKSAKVVVKLSRSFQHIA